jgi:pimeloyl-ACP methyl ester carboxylesterase
MATYALPVTRWGVGGGRRALLVHGLASSGAGWWRIGAALADAGWDVVAPDLRGHGRAPWGTDHRLADLAGDLVPLGAGWDVVVGHSLGGPIAATLVRLGVTARHLVLLDPVFEIAGDAFDGVLADQVAEADPTADAATFAAAHPRWHADDAVLKAQAARQVSPRTVEQILRSNAPWAHAGLLAGLGPPCTVLGADPAAGAMFAPELGRRVTAADPGVTCSVVAGAGHGIHRERPDVVLAAVAAGPA